MTSPAVVAKLMLNERCPLGHDRVLTVSANVRVEELAPDLAAAGFTLANDREPDPSIGSRNERHLCVDVPFERFASQHVNTFFDEDEQQANTGIGLTDVRQHLKKQRLQAKLSKIKRQIDLEFENDALQGLQEIIDQRAKLDLDSAFEVAECFYQLRKYKNCIMILDSVPADENRKQPKIQNLKGQCFIKTGNFKYAIDLFEVCLIIDPKFRVAHNNLGNIYLHQKEYEKCVMYYEKSKLCRPE